MAVTGLFYANMADPLHLEFVLHPNIPWDELRKQFATTGRVQIAEFLDPSQATLLRKHLEARDDWETEMKVRGGENASFRQAALQSVPQRHRDAFLSFAAPVELDGFRYLYDERIAIGKDGENREPTSILGQFASFLSSETVLKALRFITGADEVSSLIARATRYRPGHFLTIHNDSVAGSDRRVAYVFGLTDNWRAEWGGILLFHDESGDVMQGLVPRMNTMTFFAVPQSHSVSLVSHFTPQTRYSVTGWLLAPSPAATI